MNGTILLADDSLTIQKVVELTFADTAHEVVTVSSGDELLQKLPSVRPDLVICDVLMPGTDGYAVCQALKSDPKWLHVPVVLLTGTFEPFDRDRAIAAGCDEIITKPFEARKLVETVENLLRGGVQAVEEGEALPEQFEGAMAPPSVEEPERGAGTADAYGTVLAGEPEAEAPGGFVAGGAEESPVEATTDEGLDFTTSGFDEMRAAGERPEELPEASPDEGLEFHMDAPSSDVGEPFQPDETPEVSFPGSGAAGEDAPASRTADDAFDFGRPPTAPIELPEELGQEPEPSIDTSPAPFTTDQPPAEEQPMEAQEPSPFEEASALEAEEAKEFESPQTEPVEAPEEYEAASPAPSEAPVETAPTPPSPVFGATPEPTPPAVGLSDEDVERIARRVVELAADRLEQIAWEVIPDMAEIVVRERIRELEAEAEQDDITH